MPRAGEWGRLFASDANDRVTCKHSARRETRGGRWSPGGHFRQCTFGSAHQVATTAGGKEPHLDIHIGSSTFNTLLETGSSESILGLPAAAVAQAFAAKAKADMCALRLASDWSQSTTSLSVGLSGLPVTADRSFSAFLICATMLSWVGIF